MATVKGTEPPLAVRSSMDHAAFNGIRVTSAIFSPQFAPHIPVKQVPYARIKRVFDIVISSIALVALSPIVLIVALLVRTTSRGPIIFKQTRVGAGGKEFTCYKFRSMCADAEAKKHKLLHLNEVSGPVFKIKDDPRLTSIGKFIRKLSLDELPQLWNVFIGDMSIVGPRPPVPHEVAKYGPREFGRLAVKPGITCVWQVTGRSNIPFDHWIELDLMYIDTMSFWGDVGLVLKTIPAVLTGRGAH